LKLIKVLAELLGWSPSDSKYYNLLLDAQKNLYVALRDADGEAFNIERIPINFVFYQQVHSALK